MKLPDLVIESTLEMLPNTARQLLAHAGGQKVWLLEGEMGAGKTTLVKALCAALGVEEVVNSPTFSLVHEYATGLGEAVYHFDFYRILDEDEALALGCVEYFDSGCYCFVEWPSRVAGLLPEAYCRVVLEGGNTDQRRVRLITSVAE